MKRLFWMLSCLTLAIGQTSQATLAVVPIMSANYAAIAGSRVSLPNKGDLSSSDDNKAFIQTDKPVQAEIKIDSNDNSVRLNASQPLIALNSSALLETGNVSCSQRAQNAGFVTQSNYFNLGSGNILITPEKDIVIGTQEGTVSIASGATIFVMESGMDTVIYDLYQARPKQVCVLVNKHKLVMEPGCMLVLTKQKTKNFEDLAVNCHSISYRRAQEIDLQENNINAFVANFSIFSALVRIQPLKELIDSKDKRDQVLLHKLLKSAAMLRT